MRSELLSVYPGSTDFTVHRLQREELSLWVSFAGLRPSDQQHGMPTSYYASSERGADLLVLCLVGKLEARQVARKHGGNNMPTPTS